MGRACARARRGARHALHLGDSGGAGDEPRRRGGGRPALRHRPSPRRWRRAGRWSSATATPRAGRSRRALSAQMRARSTPSQLRLSSVPLIAPRERARAIAGVCSEAGNVVGVLARRRRSKRSARSCSARCACTCAASADLSVAPRGGALVERTLRSRRRSRRSRATRRSTAAGDDSPFARRGAGALAAR